MAAVAGKLVWDQSGSHLYETGVKNGVLYMYDAGSGSTPADVAAGTSWTGVAWNGLTAVTESPSGAEATALYADDFKYLNLYSAEEFGATIEAYTYPDEFAECDGSANIGGIAGAVLGQQERKTFALAYKTTVGNDVDGNDHGYKIHLLYGCKASPSERAYSTINDSPEAITFSWELTTTPVTVGKINSIEYKPTANVIIDSTKFTSTESKAKLAEIEDALFGKDADTQTSAAATTPHILFPSEIYTILSGS